MKDKLIKCVFLIVIGILISFIAYLSSPNIFTPYRYKILIPPASFKDNRPAGELTRGVLTEQPVLIDEEVINHLKTLYGDEVICVSVFLANYNNRQNFGNIEISLSKNGKKVAKKIDVGKIKDNTYKQVCFDDFSASSIVPGEYTIALKGIDGIHDKSITAWLTKDLPHGPAKINGEQIEHGLIFKISAQKKEATAQLHIWCLVFIYALTVALLLNALDISKRENIITKKNKIARKF